MSGSLRPGWRSGCRSSITLILITFSILSSLCHLSTVRPRVPATVKFPLFSFSRGYFTLVFLRHLFHCPCFFGILTQTNTFVRAYIPGLRRRMLLPSIFVGMAALAVGSEAAGAAAVSTTTTASSEANAFATSTSTSPSSSSSTSTAAATHSIAVGAVRTASHPMLSLCLMLTNE